MPVCHEKKTSKRKFATYQHNTDVPQKHITEVEILMKTLFLQFFLAAILCSASFASEIAGKITSLEGNAFIYREGKEIAASLGDSLFVSDSLKTDEKSMVGFTLDDDTIISMGPDSHIVIKNFIFEPRNKLFSLVTRMLKGSFVYFSGLIGSLSPDSAKIETPEANIALRGTRILVHVEN